MSTWGIGDNHDSDQVSLLKEQVRSKDAQYATLHSQLCKRDGELQEFKTSFNDVLYKLRNEADRVVKLEAALAKRNEEFQNEHLTRQNTENTLAAVQQKLKHQEQTTRELQAHLECLTSHANSSSSDKTKLERENAALQARVRELQLESQAREQRDQAFLRHSQSAASSSNNARGSRRRSSSVSTFRMTALEHEMSELRTLSGQQTSEIRALTDRLARAQESLVQTENEKIASEKRLNRQLQEIQTVLKEREEDLRMVRQAGGGEDVVMREASLLARLEDEEKRVAALEDQLVRATANHKRDARMLTEELERTQQLLGQERQQAQQLESRMLEIVSDKEQALDERDQAQMEALELEQRAKVTDSQIIVLESRVAASTSNPSLGSPLEPQSPDPETAATMQRLLNAIERLRSERDSLREERDTLLRDFEFVKAENKFALQDVEAKLAAAASATSNLLEDEVRSLREKVEKQDGLRTLLQESERRITELTQATAQTEGQRDLSQSRMETLAHDLAEARVRLDDARKALEEKDSLAARTNELVMELDAVTEDLEATRLQVLSLKENVSHLENQLLQERHSHEKTGTSLAQVETQLAEITQLLSNAEAARDALSLQLKHTEQDLNGVREELVEADTRYGQQLCAMSSGQASRAFREQIESLEQRVLRRTEQIGVHQHDIKRLETNLRLHEERLTEMTAELEVVLGQKDAMIEDCRTTREERDDARRKCEELDELAEQLELDRDLEVQSMVAMVFSAVARQRSMAQEASRVVQGYNARTSELELKLRIADEQRAGFTAHATQLAGERDDVARLVEEKTRALESLQEAKDRAEGDAHARAAALATLQTELRSTMSSSQATEEERSAMQSQLLTLQQQLSDKTAEISTLQIQLDSLRHDHSQALSQNATSYENHRAKLEEELKALQDTGIQAQSRHQQEVEALLEELRTRLLDNEMHSGVEARLRDELAQLQQQHTRETDDLDLRLQRTCVELEEAQRSHSEAVASHTEKEHALKRSKEELERQLSEVTTRMEMYARSDGQLAEMEIRYQSEVADLQERLDHALADLDVAIKAHDEVKTQQQQVAERLDGYLAESERLEAQLSKLQADHAEEIQMMQGRLEVVDAELVGVHKARSDLDAQYQEARQELSSTREDLGRKLASATEEIEDLNADLDAEKDAHSRTQQSHELELQSADARRMTAEMNLEKLAEELAGVRASLDEAEVSLQTLQEEKQELNFEITNLEAEIQRSKSLQRYLESEAKDRDQEVSSLRRELEEASTKTVQAEKANKASEVNLSMHVIQSEQTIGSLRRELSSLKAASPKLQDEIADLKEQNSEMEQLLRNKCLEIEENDDRFIELLKEKKKHNSKIESLTRKVNNLQAKLVQAAAPRVEIGLASSSRATKSITPPPIAGPSVPSMPSRSMRTPSTPKATARVASISSTQNPRTPEVRVPQPVFRARTPEAKRAGPSQPTPPVSYLVESSSSSSTIGKKRRAPDDFDGCESVPPQGFTAESMPSMAETSTPRLRRTTPRTGFTPVRSSVRPTAAPVSPIRRATTGPSMSAAAIADVTNSPRGKHGADSAAKAAKRGWLGKLKPGPAPGQRAVSSRAPVFERH